MGEDITKLKKNIEAIKKIMQGSQINATKKEGEPIKPQPVKR